ncbi:cysteine-rich and transmembrane domain-containing protein WIH1-like [Triticum dicoccoides]|uniref:cysteine-rich and transmembrane domain-containing protein WIH1-like n=1 Tax=Triticum dicoccoides TaxID=85692 RepID=UPI000E7A752A|nr:cysteine-rich and transmembrane domain-containing protein WIH1-like [Triticum dicoccoides]
MAAIKADARQSTLPKTTHSLHLLCSKASLTRPPLLFSIASGRHTCNPIMSYQQGYPQQGASATAYPQQQQAYVAPPPAGYPQRDQQYPDAGAADTTTSRGGHGHHHGGGFWRGCCAALCCCCLLDACF